MTVVDGLAAIRPLPCGPTAVVFEVASTAAAIDLAEWLRGEVPPGVVDLVPAARTVLVQCDTAASMRAVTDHVTGLGTSVESIVVGTTRVGVEVTIEVVYDGDDLDDVAAQLGVDPATVVEMHTAPTYVAAFCGFVPGFAYLTEHVAGDVPLLQLPRRSTPRTRVPAGSVAVAAGFTGVYPTASPGGWNLLGRTEIPMWDPTRARPAFAEPGDTVRFVAVQG